MPDEVASRLLSIRDRIARACERSERDPGSVTLVGAAKRQPVEALRAAHRAGLVVFGENRVQEAETMRELLPEVEEWHLIGPLQSNKARRAVEIFSTVHSVDRAKIARVLAAEAERAGRRLPCFFEVNLGNEESKHGFPADDLSARLAPLADLAWLEPLGLMAIPPYEEDPEASRPWFRRLRELSETLRSTPAWSHLPAGLSMGMSGDFEVAVEEGASHVRVGTALFGPRESA
ncbi:MAG: YggS family pyridoxal phosphate-dependent enzyme [Thermoanaerobaculia bacterium]